MSFTITDMGWADALQQGLEEYMMQCHDSIDADEEFAGDSGFETESGWPFCGCNTCEYREILSFLVPRIITASAEGKVVLDA
jgi:hypothetical protein